MPLRDAINPFEEEKLVRAMKAGRTWDEVRGILPGVDPTALDKGFKERVMRQAGLEPMPERRKAKE